MPPKIGRKRLQVQSPTFLVFRQNVVAAGGSSTIVAGLNASNSVIGSNVTNYYGLKISNGITSGTVANRYGIHIVSSGSTTATDYGIYQVSTTAKNYFGGRTGFGNTSATA